MDDDPTRNAATTAAHVLRNAFAEIRKAYPFLNSDDLSETIGKMGKQLQDDLLTKEAAMKAAEDRFTIYKLPAELRVNFYELVLARDEDKPFETQTTRLTRGSSQNVLKDPMPALLRVSRQVRHEASPIFYSKTRFAATFDYNVLPTAYIATWLRMIGARSAGQIKHLEVRLPNSTLDDIKWVMFDVAQSHGGEMPLDEEDYPALSKPVTLKVLKIEELGVAGGVVKVAYHVTDREEPSVWKYLD